MYSLTIPMYIFYPWELIIDITLKGVKINLKLNK